MTACPICKVKGKNLWTSSFLPLSFPVDISNTLETKNIENPS